MRKFSTCAVLKKNFKILFVTNLTSKPVNSVSLKVTLKGNSSPLSTMDSLPPLTSTAAFQNLQKFFDANKTKININALFKNDPERFKKLRLVEYFFIENNFDL